MDSDCYLRNIQGLLSDGKTPYERGFGIPFNGPVIPFGAMVENQPHSAKDLSRVHQFDPKILPGTFLDMHWTREESGKETYWSQTLKNEQVDASEIHARRLNAEEVSTPMKGDNFKFPVADGTVKISLEETNVWEHPLLSRISYRTRRRTRKFSTRTRRTLFSITTSTLLNVRKLKLISGLLQEISFIAITWNPESKCTCLKKNHFLFWNVENRTLTITGMLMEVVHCQIRGPVSKDSPYWKRNHQMGFRGPGGDWQENKRPPDPKSCGQKCGNTCQVHPNVRKSKKWAIEKPKLDHARSLRGVYFIDPEDKEFKDMMKKCL